MGKAIGKNRIWGKAKIWIFAAVAACMASHMDLVAYAGEIDSDYQEELVEFESLIDEITDYVTEMDPSEKGEDGHYGELLDLIDEASELVSGYLDEETGDWVGSVPTLEQLEDMEQRLRETFEAVKAEDEGGSAAEIETQGTLRIEKNTGGAKAASAQSNAEGSEEQEDEGTIFGIDKKIVIIGGGAAAALVIIAILAVVFLGGKKKENTGKGPAGVQRWDGKANQNMQQNNVGGQPWNVQQNPNTPPEWGNNTAWNGTQNPNTPPEWGNNAVWNVQQNPNTPPGWGGQPWGPQSAGDEDTTVLFQGDEDTTRLLQDESEKTTLLRGASLYSPKTGETIPVKRPEFVIGKERARVDYCIGNTTVSRNHAKITATGNGYSITDLNSTNGTFLNGMRLAPGQPALLQNGDQVAFSDEEFVFHM